ncbi:hypothetical protein GQ53DRAFT_767357 [Thozetella sp. PMI_491]|nr:hypothetical protein GQ53DRAFT_767357 [Thozetella sp. PMI_491]
MDVGSAQRIPFLVRRGAKGGGHADWATDESYQRVLPWNTLQSAEPGLERREKEANLLRRRRTGISRVIGADRLGLLPYWEALIQGLVLTRSADVTLTSGPWSFALGQRPPRQRPLVLLSPLRDSRREGKVGWAHREAVAKKGANGNRWFAGQATSSRHAVYAPLDGGEARRWLRCRFSAVAKCAV